MCDWCSFRGETIKITVWLARRERATWITGAEILGVALVLSAVPGTIVRLVAFLLLGHLGYTALTSLPMGAIPGRPEGTTHERRNLHLRSRVGAFLNEVRRVEGYAQRAKTAGKSRGEVEEDLRAAERRMMLAAAEVVKVTGRTGI